MRALTYLLPFRSDRIPSNEFIEFINELAVSVELILIDGSSDSVFDAVEDACAPAVKHMRPDADLAALPNGKVRGVLTGLRVASHDKVIVADDDVRHTAQTLDELASALNTAEVIRPQNYFSPLPWHARIDTARTLINRMTGGDWPGTLAIRRSTLLRTGGYDGSVLFENLELVRTVEAARGTVRSMPQLFVRRLPPDGRHFWSQRVRQAYDEFARPARLCAALSIVPFAILSLATGYGRWGLSALVIIPIIVAECGRQRSRGVRVFPFSASLCAPVWVLERGICAWLAVGVRLLRGGIRYRGQLVRTAANSPGTLMRRHAEGAVRR